MMMTKYGLVSHFQLNNVADDMIDKDFEMRMESIKETIDAILQDAERIGLRNEIEQTAKQYIAEFPEMDILQAYEDAFIDWDCL